MQYKDGIKHIPYYHNSNVVGTLAIPNLNEVDSYYTITTTSNKIFAWQISLSAKTGVNLPSDITCQYLCGIESSTNLWKSWTPGTINNSTDSIGPAPYISFKLVKSGYTNSPVYTVPNFIYDEPNCTIIGTNNSGEQRGKIQPKLDVRGIYNQSNFCKTSITISFVTGTRTYIPLLQSKHTLGNHDGTTTIPTTTAIWDLTTYTKTFTFTNAATTTSESFDVFQYLDNAYWQNHNYQINLTKTVNNYTRYGVTPSQTFTQTVNLKDLELSFPPYGRTIEILTKSYVKSTSTYELVFTNYDRSPLSLTIYSLSAGYGEYYNHLVYNNVSSHSLSLLIDANKGQATVNVGIDLEGDYGYKLVLDAPANSYYSAINSKLATFCNVVGWVTIS
jgi:hypothetical protein